MALTERLQLEMGLGEGGLLSDFAQHGDAMNRCWQFLTWLANEFLRLVSGSFRQINLKLDSIEGKVVKIMATQAEAAVELVALKAQLVKANDEIQAKIQALTDAANNASNVSPELAQAIADLKPAAQTLDDIVPDAPPTV